MHEGFDPDTVERRRGDDLLRVMNSGNLNLQWTDWVKAEDYDSLLALYRDKSSKIKDDDRLFGTHIREAIQVFKGMRKK